MGLPSLKSLTLDQIASSLSRRDFTVTDLTKAHLERIHKYNTKIHAVIETNPDALLHADRLDKELSTSGSRGLLHGVPILIKDNVVTFEKMEATAGSLALVGAKPDRESPVVQQLRSAGCVILGTANISEWANFRSKESDSGWSPRGGQTYGTYTQDMEPGGSSSGSSVAVDMGFCVLAVGSETSGSIISPAKQNGVVGLKPTTGLISRDAVIPISPEQDTLGPIARTVEDAAIMLTAMAGKDINDSKTDSIPFTTIPDYRAACKQTSLSNYRIGIPRHTFNDEYELHPYQFEMFDGIVDKLRAAGAEVMDVEFPAFEQYSQLEGNEKTDYMSGEFHHAIDQYFSTLVTNPNGIRKLEDVITFIKATAEEEYETRGAYRLEHTLEVTHDSPEYKAAKKRAAYFAGEGGIQGALDRHQLDALLLPSDVWCPNYFAACEGHPQISVPVGYRPEDHEIIRNDTGNLVSEAPNVPFAFSVIGAKFSEERLLPICAFVERETRARDSADEHRLPEFRD